MYINFDKLMQDYCNNVIDLSNEKFDVCYNLINKDVDNDLEEQYMVKVKINVSSKEVNSFDLYAVCQFIRDLGIHVEYNLVNYLINACKTGCDYYKSVAIDILANKVDATDLAIFVKYLWNISA